MKPDFFEGLASVILTLLLVYDFFPNFISLLYIPKTILIGLMIAAFLISIFTNRFHKDQLRRYALNWQLISLGYLLALIIIFTLAGGVSQVGISLTNPFLWIALVISIFDIVKGYKRLRASQLSSET